jgi:hypothetical protein
MNKVVIFVSGGVVTEVLGDCTYEIIDYDNLKAEGKSDIEIDKIELNARKWEQS